MMRENNYSGIQRSSIISHIDQVLVFGNILTIKTKMYAREVKSLAYVKCNIIPLQCSCKLPGVMSQTHSGAYHVFSGRTNMQLKHIKY